MLLSLQHVHSKQIMHRDLKTQNVLLDKKREVVKIGDIGKVITGKTPSTAKPEYWQGNIPFITPGDIGDTPYIYRTNRYVSMNGAKIAGGLLPKNSVLVVCIGSTIGKVGLTYKESVTNQQINAIICNTNVNPHYVYYVLYYNSERLKSWSGATAVPIIKKSLFENFKIPLPPLEEQKAIAERLKAIDDLIEIKRKEKEQIEKAKKKVMDLLLTGKVRIKNQNS